MSSTAKVLQFVSQFLDFASQFQILVEQVAAIDVTIGLSHQLTGLNFQVHNLLDQLIFCFVHGSIIPGFR